MTHRFSGPARYAGRHPTRGEWYDDLPVVADPDFVVLFDDFVVPTLDTDDWDTITDTGASVAIEADTEAGRVLLSSAATTDDNGAAIKGEEIFALADERGVWFKTRMQISDADQTEMFAGLAVDFSTNPENLATAADRIGFQSDDGDASLLAKTEKDGTETSTDTGIDLSDATDVVLAFRVVGTNAVEFYVDGKLVATHTANLPDDENLEVAAYHLSGEASGTKTSSWDYFLAAMDR